MEKRHFGPSRICEAAPTTTVIMTKNIFSLLAVLAIVGLCKVNACMDKFDNADMLKNVTDACQVKLNMKEGDIPKTQQEWLADSFDDKCLSQCIFQEMGFANAKGELDKKMMKEEIKAHAPKDMHNGLDEIVKKCDKAYEKESKTNPAEICKAALNFHRCYTVDANKFC